METLIKYYGHISAVMPLLIKGAVLTVQITAVSVFFGTIIGLVLSLMKISSNKFFRFVSAIYVDFIRGTPLLIQILLIYFGIPGVIREITGETFRMAPLIAGAIACSINSGAYVSEIFRAGIQSIERGQMEAARSLGMTKSQAMISIILPQAFKRVVPPMGNEFIILLKDSSLLSVIGVHELTRQGQLYIAVTFASFPVYLAIAFVYLIMTFSISRLVAYLERRLSISDRRD